MKTNRFQHSPRAILAVWRLLSATFWAAVVLVGSAPTGKLYAADDGQRLVQKVCENCGRTVSRAAQRGQTCPHCGAYWADERTIRQTLANDSSSPSTEAPSSHSRESMSLKPSSRRTWPKLPHQVQGVHHLFIDNHTSTDLWIGLRDGAKGADIRVAAHGKSYLGLPEGTYRTYVFRHDQPTSLYEAANIKMGGGNVIRSTQTFCIWFDEDEVDQLTGLPIAAAR